MSGILLQPNRQVIFSACNPGLLRISYLMLKCKFISMNLIISVFYFSDDEMCALGKILQLWSFIILICLVSNNPHARSISAVHLPVNLVTKSLVSSQRVETENSLRNLNSSQEEKLSQTGEKLETISKNNQEYVQVTESSFSAKAFDQNSSSAILADVTFSASNAPPRGKRATKNETSTNWSSTAKGKKDIRANIPSARSEPNSRNETREIGTSFTEPPLPIKFTPSAPLTEDEQQLAPRESSTIRQLASNGKSTETSVPNEDFREVIQSEKDESTHEEERSQQPTGKGLKAYNIFKQIFTSLSNIFLEKDELSNRRRQTNSNHEADRHPKLTSEHVDQDGTPKNGSSSSDLPKSYPLNQQRLPAPRDKDGEPSKFSGLTKSQDYYNRAPVSSSSQNQQISEYSDLVEEKQSHPGISENGSQLHLSDKNHLENRQNLMPLENYLQSEEIANLIDEIGKQLGILPPTNILHNGRNQPSAPDKESLEQTEKVTKQHDAQDIIHSQTFSAKNERIQYDNSPKFRNPEEDLEEFIRNVFLELIKNYTHLIENPASPAQHLQPPQNEIHLTPLTGSNFESPTSQAGQEFDSTVEPYHQLLNQLLYAVDVHDRHTAPESSGPPSVVNRNEHFHGTHSGINRDASMHEKSAEITYPAQTSNHREAFHAYRERTRNSLETSVHYPKLSDQNHRKQSFYNSDNHYSPEENPHKSEYSPLHNQEKIYYPQKSDNEYNSAHNPPEESSAPHYAAVEHLHYPKQSSYGNEEYSLRIKEFIVYPEKSSPGPWKLEAPYSPERSKYPSKQQVYHTLETHDSDSAEGLQYYSNLSAPYYVEDHDHRTDKTDQYLPDESVYHAKNPTYYPQPEKSYHSVNSIQHVLEHRYDDYTSNTNDDDGYPSKYYDDYQSENTHKSANVATLPIHDPHYHHKEDYSHAKSREIKEIDAQNLQQLYDQFYYKNGDINYKGAPQNYEDTGLQTPLIPLHVPEGTCYVYINHDFYKIRAEDTMAKAKILSSHYPHEKVFPLKCYYGQLITYSTSYFNTLGQRKVEGYNQIDDNRKEPVQYEEDFKPLIALGHVYPNNEDSGYASPPATTYHSPSDTTYYSSPASIHYSPPAPTHYSSAAPTHYSPPATSYHSPSDSNYYSPPASNHHSSPPAPIHNSPPDLTLHSSPPAPIHHSSPDLTLNSSPPAPIHFTPPALTHHSPPATIHYSPSASTHHSSTANTDSVDKFQSTHEPKEPPTHENFSGKVEAAQEEESEDRDSKQHTNQDFQTKYGPETAHIEVIKVGDNLLEFRGKIHVGNHQINSSSSVDEESNVLNKKPSFFWLSKFSTRPVDQDKFTVRKYLNMKKFLVHAHDFNPLFQETIYVDNSVNGESEISYGPEVQKCNTCNHKFNKSYGRYNDWTERFLSCHSFFPFSNVDRNISTQKYVPPKSCPDNTELGKICNPCGRRQKVVSVPGTESYTVELPYSEILKTGETFFDKDSNMYSFTSFSAHNVEFDQHFGFGPPDNLDTRQMFKYFNASIPIEVRNSK